MANKARLGKHPVSAQAGPSKNGTPGSGMGEEVYDPIPVQLVHTLVSPVYQNGLADTDVVCGQDKTERGIVACAVIQQALADGLHEDVYTGGASS